MSCHVMSPAGKTMEIEEALLSTPINPNNFPAKLWRLVNSPRYQSIRWDSRGEGVIIDQQLFESELLCPSKPLDDATELFKTTNFTSFIRQLNLYGFRKVVLGVGSNPGQLHPGGDLGAGDGHLHHFHNVHFRKDHPDMLVNLKRLTSANKAKLAAGLEVNSRPPNRFQRLLTNSLDSMGKGDKHDEASTSTAPLPPRLHAPRLSKGKAKASVPTTTTSTSATATTSATVTCVSSALSSAALSSTNISVSVHAPPTSATTEVPAAIADLALVTLDLVAVGGEEAGMQGAPSPIGSEHSDFGSNKIFSPDQSPIHSPRHGTEPAIPQLWARRIRALEDRFSAQSEELRTEQNCGDTAYG